MWPPWQQRFCLWNFRLLLLTSGSLLLGGFISNYLLSAPLQQQMLRTPTVHHGRVRAPPVAKLQLRVREALSLIFSFSTWLLPLISTFFVVSRDFFLGVSNNADKVLEVKGHNKNDDGAICPVLVGCCCVCFIDALSSRVWVMLVNICVTVVTVIDRWSLGNVSSRQWNCAHVCASVNYCMCTCLAYLSWQWFTCLRYAATLYWLLIHWW